MGRVGTSHNSLTGSLCSVLFLVGAFFPFSWPRLICSTKACLASCPNLMWAEGWFHTASLSRLKQRAKRPKLSASSPFNYTLRPYPFCLTYTLSSLARVRLIFHFIQRSYGVARFWWCIRQVRKQNANWAEKKDNTRRKRHQWKEETLKENLFFSFQSISIKYLKKNIYISGKILA